MNPSPAPQSIEELNTELTDASFEASVLTIEEMDAMLAVERQIEAIESSNMSIAEQESALQNLATQKGATIDAMLQKVADAQYVYEQSADNVNHSIESGLTPSEAELQTIQKANQAFNEAADEFNELVEAVNSEDMFDVTAERIEKKPLENIVDGVLTAGALVTDGSDVTPVEQELRNDIEAEGFLRA